MVGVRVLLESPYTEGGGPEGSAFVDFKAAEMQYKGTLHVTPSRRKHFRNRSAEPC